MSEKLSDKFPVIYKGYDGVEYQAVQRPATDNTLIPRVSIHRTDGEPIVVKGVSYPTGYVAGHGKLFAENFLNSLNIEPEY